MRDKRCMPAPHQLYRGLMLLQCIAFSFAVGTAAAQSPPAQTLQLCAACHGDKGNSQMPGSPSLAGQPRVFIENQLVMIREGLREVAQMKGLLTDMKDEEFTVLAKYYSQQKIQAQTMALNTLKVARGAVLSKRGQCGSCHLPDYAGRDQMPRLAGQREDFLLSSMKEFRDGRATGRDTIMAATLRGLSDGDLTDLAHYLATAGDGAK